jgi:hypothetical protein
VFNDVGALFAPFSPQIVAYALETWKTPNPRDRTGSITTVNIRPSATF